MVVTNLTAVRTAPAQDLSRGFSLGVASLAVLFRIWQERRRHRRDLSRMSDHMLKDIGLTPGEALDEMAKPFWRA